MVEPGPTGMRCCAVSDSPSGPVSVLGVTDRSGGRTTLARCVAGLLHERHDGRFLLGGESLPAQRRRSAEQKRRVQYVWQETRGSFDDRRTVLRQEQDTSVLWSGHDPRTLSSVADRSHEY